MTGAGWIGVDLDGTLAEYQGWVGVGHIGPPIRLMVARVKDWLEQGWDVRIFTARAAERNPTELLAIEEWCREHIGRALPVTATKDYQMVELWDDRAVGVEHNTGRLRTGPSR